MKFLAFLLILFSLKSFSDNVFSLKRKNRKQIKTQSSYKFKRESFKFSEDFLILSKKKPLFKNGTVLNGYLEKDIFSSYKESLPVFVKTYKPQALFLGEIKALKNKSHAMLSLNEVIINHQINSIEALPIIIKGNKRDAFLKDVLFNFFLELPKTFGLIFNRSFDFLSFNNKDFISIEKEKRELLEYLVIKQDTPIKIIIK